MVEQDLVDALESGKGRSISGGPYATSRSSQSFELRSTYSSTSPKSTLSSSTTPTSYVPARELADGPLPANTQYITPHVAAFTEDITIKSANEVFENIIQFLKTGKPNTPVNDPKR